MLSRLIDRYNPGITLLVFMWVAGISTRRYLDEREMLSVLGYQALTSLVYVVPIMLVGWGVLAVSDRVFGLGIFRDDE